MNNIIISGRLTQKPELKHTKSGKNVCDFNIAVNRGVKNEKGEYICDFINCRCWGYTADNLTKWQDKGDYIVVQGKLQVDSFTDKDGNNRYATYVLTDNVEFTPRKKEATTTPQEDKLDPKNMKFDDSDLPFYG